MINYDKLNPNLTRDVKIVYDRLVYLNDRIDIVAETVFTKGLDVIFNEIERAKVFLSEVEKGLKNDTNR